MCFNQLEAKGLAREWINRPSSLRNDKTGVVSLSFWHCFCRPRALTSSAVARGSFFPALQSKEEKLGSRTHHESGSPSAIWACTQRCCLYRVRPFTWTESQLPVVCLQPALQDTRGSDPQENFVRRPARGSCPSVLAQVVLITSPSRWFPVCHHRIRFQHTNSGSVCSYHIFTAVLFTVAKRWKQPNVHGQKNGYTKCGLCIQWIIKE